MNSIAELLWRMEALGRLAGWLADRSIVTHPCKEREDGAPSVGNGAHKHHLSEVGQPSTHQTFLGAAMGDDSFIPVANNARLRK